MPLGRSVSGPGALSINTSSANSIFGSGTSPAPAASGTGLNTQTQTTKPLFGAIAATTAPSGLFGATTQPQVSEGMFAASSQPAASGGLFGGSSQPAASGGLFGATATTQTQSGGLFGNAQAQAASQPPAGGLFGAAATTQAPAGGLFGNTQPSSGGLFGNTGTSQPASTGGMFGATQNQSGGGGLFGNSSATQQSGTGGLFGGQGTQNQAKPSGSLFGNLGSTQNQQSQPAMFNQSRSQSATSGPFPGGLTMGQGNQQPQVVPGVRIDMANVRGTTRFSDLQTDLQTEIERLDKLVNDQIRSKSQCDAFIPKHEEALKTIPNSVEFCRRKLIGVQTAQNSDVEIIAHVQSLVKVDAENARLSFTVVDNLSLPPQFHINDGWQKTQNNRSQENGNEDSSKLVRFVSETADELETTLAKYQNNIAEIELHLRNIEATSAQQINALIARRNNPGSTVNDDAVRDLADALTEFEQGILHVAGKVGGTREAVQTLQLGSFTGTTNGKAANFRRSGVY